MSQLETSNLQKANKWFTLVTYVVHSARHLNTYIHVSVGNKQPTTNKKVVYSGNLCGSLSTTFEYIHPCLSWKQAIYKKPISGLLCGSLSTTFEYIHTYMSQLETSILQQTKKWFTLVTYVVHSARHLNIYIHASVGNR